MCLSSLSVVCCLLCALCRFESCLLVVCVVRFVVLGLVWFVLFCLAVCWFVCYMFWVVCVVMCGCVLLFAVIVLCVCRVVLVCCCWLRAVCLLMLLCVVCCLVCVGLCCVVLFGLLVLFVSCAGVFGLC